MSDFADLSHFRWLAKLAMEWLEKGEVEHAVQAFHQIPRDVLAADPAFREVEQHVEDAREAIALGESVYPAHVPIRERWCRPRAVGQMKDGHELQRWMPGRVVDADDAFVSFVVAMPEAKRVILQRVMQRRT